jgi:RHS repeat-associated protein
VAKYAYDAYGQNTNVASDVGPGAKSYLFRYTGQRLDPNTGLYDYKARDYSPVLGRFYQPDPAGVDQGPNLYGYVGNDPLGSGDPSGECNIIACHNDTDSQFGPFFSGTSSEGSMLPSGGSTGGADSVGQIALALPDQPPASQPPPPPPPPDQGDIHTSQAATVCGWACTNEQAAEQQRAAQAANSTRFLWVPVLAPLAVPLLASGAAAFAAPDVEAVAGFGGPEPLSIGPNPILSGARAEVGAPVRLVDIDWGASKVSRPGAAPNPVGSRPPPQAGNLIAQGVMWAKFIAWMLHGSH